MLDKFCAGCLGFHPVCAVETVDGVQGREFVGHVELIDMLTLLHASKHERSAVWRHHGFWEKCHQ
jgi:hypothetical protein